MHIENMELTFTGPQFALRDGSRFRALSIKLEDGAQVFALTQYHALVLLREARANNLISETALEATQELLASWEKSAPALPHSLDVQQCRLLWMLRTFGYNSFYPMGHKGDRESAHLVATTCRHCGKAYLATMELHTR